MSRDALFHKLFTRSFPLIGVVHLPALPGYPEAPKGARGIDRLIEHAYADLNTLEACDFDGILIENENDQPHRVLAAPETIAVMTRVTSEVVRSAKSIVVGAEILLNDPKASLAVANASGARFIRTDYFVDRMARDEYGGEMHIDAKGVVAYRESIGAGDVAIFADIQVKYARMLEPRSIAESTRLAKAERADGIIVTGALTGNAPVTKDLSEATAAAGGHPILIGSGLTAANAHALLPHASGAIVGTGIMTGGKIDRMKASQLMEAVQILRRAR